MSLSARGKLAGIIGWPVSHSLSPQLHGHWLREHNIDGAYVPLPVAREDFTSALAGLGRAGFAGVNVTVPHKEAAFALAHALDEMALAAGAVNLLLIENGRFIGRNTDVPGLRASLAEALGAEGLRGQTVVVLGAGGAARAAVLACNQLQAGNIRVVSRQTSRAEALKALVPTALTPFAWNDWARAAENAQLLINATSAGMKGAPPLALDLNALPRQATVCDLVYNPLETELLKAARARGHRTIDGLGMLMHQAVPAFEAFFGVKPHVSPALRAELEQALRRG
jgi:shikimate dehydrogenase